MSDSSNWTVKALTFARVLDQALGENRFAQLGLPSARQLAFRSGRANIRVRLDHSQQQTAVARLQ